VAAPPVAPAPVQEIDPIEELVDDDLNDEINI
jgi:hypothetical protein